MSLKSMVTVPVGSSRIPSVSPRRLVPWSRPPGTVAHGCGTLRGPRGAATARSATLGIGFIGKGAFESTEAGMSVVGRVASLWRYPVKSMAAEELDGAEVSWHG